jgi:flagellar biosynthesis protein FlhF
MKLKPYFAKNMRLAMELVRSELGDDAVIMSTRNTSDGVEVVAAIDTDNQQNQQAKANFDSKQAYRNPPHTQKINNDLAMNQEIHNLANELKSVKTMLKDQLSGLAWNQAETTDPKKVALLKRLVQLGIGWDLAQDLVSNGQKKSIQAWSEILIELEERIPVAETDVVDSGGVVALVGPTGVGKTTTIAKMASRFVMRNSASQLALISTDCYKIGAQAQLKTFADLLGVPVHVAASEGELYSLLASLANKKLILIDTAGMSQKDSMMRQQPTKEKMGVNSIRNYLVMSAATQLSVMNDVVESFSKVGLKGGILTKLDEATQLGNAVTTLIENSLPLVYTSGGQKVPEDLDIIKARELVDRAMVLGQQNHFEGEEIAFKLGMGRDISNAQ